MIPSSVLHVSLNGERTVRAEWDCGDGRTKMRQSKSFFFHARDMNAHDE